MRILTSMPVFGFETSGCHCKSYDKDSSKSNQDRYRGANAVKVAGCIPLLGGIPTGLLWIQLGVVALRGEFSPENFGECEHPKLKGAAMITRGVITILGGGILCALADLATTAGRAARARLSS